VSNLCPNLLAFAPMAWQPQMKSKKAKLYMHNSHEADSGGFIARRFCLVGALLICIAIGWVRLLGAELLRRFVDNYEIVGFGFAWGLVVTTTTTVIVFVGLAYKAFRFIFRSTRSTTN